MKNLSAHIIRKWAFYSITVLATTTLVSYQNCGKVKFNASRDRVVVQQSCGTIAMAPQNGLSEDTDITFTVTPPNGITITDLDWSFTKGSSPAPVYTSTANPVTHAFNGANEGIGDYLATVTFMKSDGNACELARSFQIITGDLCVDPSGISGPTVGYVGEETSPFSVDYEDCFVGTVVWDMETDGIPEFSNGVTETVTHIYRTPGRYTVTATVIDGEDNSQTVLTHTILINYANCTNGATNPPSCDQCPTGQSLIGGQCVPNCANGANDPPKCVTCPAGQSLVGGQCIPNCTNGATNPPPCDQCPTGQVMTGNQCTTPANCMVGTTQVLHGATRTFYDNSNVGCGTGQSPTCTSQDRTCNNGTMSGSANFSAIACMAVTCPTTCQNGANNPPQCTTCPTGRIMVGGQCIIPNGCSVNGIGMAHGETRTFYSSQVAPCGAACNGEARTCSNGVISGNPAYEQATCSVSSCNACTMDGVTVPHGQSGTFYNASTVACGQTCASTTRTCNNGVFSGNTAYNAATCTVGACACVFVPRQTTCFVAGTPITLANGKTKSIEDIKVGDEILIYDEETGEQKTSPTTEVKHHEARSQMMYNFEFTNGSKFTVTGEHLIFTAGEGYVPAMYIYEDFKNKKISHVLDMGYNSVTIKNATAEIKSAPTYNIHVKGISENLAKYGRNGRGHNYYANGILAHNLKWCCTPGCENTAPPPGNNCCVSQPPMRLPGTNVNCMSNRVATLNDNLCGENVYQGCEDFGGSPGCAPIPTTYSWNIGAWSACSATACGTDGTQNRSVTCERNDGATVADSFCGAKPAVTQACSAEACQPPPGGGGSCPEECAQYEQGGACTSTPVHGGCSVFCPGNGQIYYRCR